MFVCWTVCVTAESSVGSTEEARGLLLSVSPPRGGRIVGDGYHHRPIMKSRHRVVGLLDGDDARTYHGTK